MSFNPSKVLLASVFALGLATLPLALSASAQTDTTTAPSNTSGTNSSQGVDSTRDDRGFDWGLLGLFGLAGLAGLKRKPEQTQVYRDPNEVNRPGSRV